MTVENEGLDADLVALARRVVAENRAAGRRIAVAESCTGGLVSAAITAIPGSSEVFEVGFVTYSNDIKMSVLRVDSDILETFGAVSPACAWAMACGALEKSGADIAVSITGIAGPDGGTAQKPVGTVVFAQARKGAAMDDAIADTRHFADEGRGAIRLHAARVALELLLPEASP